MTLSSDPRADAELARQAIQQDLADHYFWLPKILLRAGLWSWFVPWPFLWLWSLATRRGRGSINSHGSLWLTADIAIFVCLLACRPGIEAAATAYAGDAAKTLFSGAFLVGTILSLSVATPGQAILKLVLHRKPAFAVSFVTPSLWAFLWGAAAGTMLTFYAGLANAVPSHSGVGIWLQRIAIAIGVYAASMELNAILFTIRMYLLGLTQIAGEAHDGPNK